MDWKTEVIRRLYRIWTSTLRFTKIGALPEPPAVIVTWHRKLWGAVYAYVGHDAVGLASKHRDAEPIAAILRDFGLGVVRGSTTRGSVSGSLGLVRALRRKKLVAITPDGPKGPAGRFQKGAWALAKMLRVPLVYTGVGYVNFVRFNSWDRFELPLPFSKVFVVFHVAPPPESPEAAGVILNRVTEKAEQLAWRWKLHVQS